MRGRGEHEHRWAARALLSRRPQEARGVYRVASAVPAGATGPLPTKASARVVVWFARGGKASARVVILQTKAFTPGPRRFDLPHAIAIYR
jgi:hypothetical protein